ncbi:MAG: hypothetical protein M1820_000577 [Bogoriella megaspora]|nr:MAG: hypothetical protein M1820_000577 [Bogoriella megaspora]
MENIMGGTPIQVVAWYAPLAAGGCIIASLGGLVLHLIPGSLLIIVASICWIISPLLFALIPPGGNYWAWVFPSMICATTAIDTTFNITNIFITTSLPMARQGLAGALINVLLQLGIALCLGWADVVATQTSKYGEARSYKNAFWFEVGCAGVALVLLVGFVRIDKAKSDLTADEKEALALAARESLATERRMTLERRQSELAAQRRRTLEDREQMAVDRRVAWEARASV